MIFNAFITALMIIMCYDVHKYKLFIYKCIFSNKEEKYVLRNNWRYSKFKKIGE